MKKTALFLLAITGAGFVFSQTTLTLQPDSTAGKDAFLHGVPAEVNNNFGTNQQLPARAWTFSGVPGVIRAVFQFDLSSIPSNATINSAELSLYAWGSNLGLGQHSTLSGSNDCWLERITSSWTETGVTWNNQPSTSSVNQVSLPASTSANQNYLNMDVTALVQDMVSNPLSSFGFMLKLQNENYYRGVNFCSSDHVNPALRPKLVVTYVVSGINESLLTPNSVSVYPNPCREKVTFNILDFNNTQENSLVVLNAMGQEISSVSLWQSVSEFNTNGLASGIYFYQLRRQGRIAKTGKFVVE